jgi:hypothetical protein
MRYSAFSLLLAALLGLVISGCDLLGGDDDTDGPTLSTTGVYVANQGNFGDGNGSVTVYDPETQQARPAAVDGLNSIVQGLALRDSSLFVVANSAARLDVFSVPGLSQTAQLTGLSGPRYLTFTGDQTAFVTDQSFGGPDAVRVLDLSGPQPQIETSISVPGTADGITTAGGRVYAALGAFGDTSLVAAVNPDQRTLTETIDVGCTTRYVVADADAEVFVLCSDAAEAVVLEGQTGAVQTRLSLADTAETAFGVGQPAAFSPEAQELHVATDTGILRIDTESNTPGPVLDVGGSSPIGAVAYDGVREELYVARPAGFTERGSVTVHARDGTQTTSFRAGIAPTYLALRRVDE